jgi:TetR/AcrR family transcriptional repressor of nem operon
MRVSRAQAEQNRRNVIDTACRLFREHGFDGIGLKDLMTEAGLTQGAFYKQFESKDDLIAHATDRALETASGRWVRAAAARPEDPLSAVVGFYLSPQHRDQRMDGCPVVALGGDVARQGPEVKAPFEAGIRDHLARLADWIGAADGDAADDRAMAILATMVGAMILARAVNDDGLSRRVLAAAADSVLSRTANGTDKTSGAALQ